jgi:hypothetical protein
MKYRPSAFCEDTVKLTFRDVLRLLMGFDVKDGPLVLNLYRMPSTYAERAAE